ncbi:unnamed protein product, partial [Ectocarpus sp. 12 AP-2014]
KRRRRRRSDGCERPRTNRWRNTPSSKTHFWLAPSTSLGLASCAYNQVPMCWWWTSKAWTSSTPSLPLAIRGARRTMVVVAAAAVPTPHKCFHGRGME